MIGDSFKLQFYSSTEQLSCINIWFNVLSVKIAYKVPSNRSVLKSMVMLSLFLIKSFEPVSFPPPISPKSKMNSLSPTTLYSYHLDNFLAMAIAKSVWFKYMVIFESGYIPYEFNMIPSYSKRMYAIILTGSSHS